MKQLKEGITFKRCRKKDYIAIVKNDTDTDVWLKVPYQFGTFVYRVCNHNTYKFNLEMDREILRSIECDEYAIANVNY